MTSLEVRQGDALERLREMPDGSVQTCITSPPYWGLRDYGTSKWDGGDDDCDHTPPHDSSRGTVCTQRANQYLVREYRKGLEGGMATQESAEIYRHTCGKCGAIRVDGQIGQEATPEDYVAGMVEVFREVKRVLRDDGTLWLNLGDSYSFPGGRHGEQSIKAKNLVGIPWRMAFALQADGWYLRCDIIWHKPNPMPESVTDRPTKSHEYIFLLTKSKKYFYDHDAVKEESVTEWNSKESFGTARPKMEKMSERQLQLQATQFATNSHHDDFNKTGRNKRSVWTITTKGYKEAHFATFPPELPQTCIEAGTSEGGCCATCGAPRLRIIEQTRIPTGRYGFAASGNTDRNDEDTPRFAVTTEHKGWMTQCDHDGDPVPCVVLDPFSGAGTTGMVAARLGRSYIGIELNPEYAKISNYRIVDDCPLFNTVEGGA